MKRKILLNPGPATTTDSVKMAQIVPDICPREKEFGQLLSSIRTDLVKIAAKNYQEYACVLFAGSGTAAMESAICSVASPNKKMLIINNGAYGERMVSIAKTYKIPFKELKYDWHSVPDLEEIKKAFEEVCCVAAVHHETTSGLLNPIKEIGKIAKENNCSFIVDAISSYAGIAFDAHDYNIDFLISASNKCIQGMPGVSFVICRKSELEKIKNYEKRAFYLDLHSQYAHLENGKQTRFTPPVQVLYALRQAIDEFFMEGAQNREERYKRSWETLVSGLKNIGFRLLLPDNLKFHSKILTTVFEPKNKEYNFDNLHDILYKKDFTIYPGKIGSMSTFRIANMGAIDSEDIENFLSALKESLGEMGITKLDY